MCEAQLAWQSHKRDFDGFINGIPIRTVHFAPASPQVSDRMATMMILNLRIAKFYFSDC